MNVMHLSGENDSCNNAVMSMQAMLKSDRIDSSSLDDPFKGRTLLRSPKAKPVQTISIQYDYQKKTPPDKQESTSKVEEKVPLLPSSSFSPPPLPPPPKLNNVPKGRVLSRTPPQSKSEEEQMKMNYIPKGNVLARTPPEANAPSLEEGSSLIAHRKNSIDYLRLPLHASRLERISMREYFEYEKDLLNSNLQSRLDNAKSKLDTGRAPVRAKRKANKGVQVSLLKIPLPKSESPPELSSEDNKIRKLPEIGDTKKSKPYLKARKAIANPKKAQADPEEDKGGTVEEFVLAMRMIKRKDGSHEVKEVELKPVAQGSESKNGKKGSKKSTLPVRIF